MYQEKKMIDTIRYMFSMLLPDYSQEEVDHEMGVLDMEAVTQAVRANAETVYTYKASGDYERAFAYFGSELFSKRATKLFESMNRMDADLVLTSHVDELWLLEDMTPVVVSCMSLTAPYEDGSYQTEYRTFKGTLDADNAMYFCPDDLIDQLQELCEPQMDNEAPVYEL